MIYNGRDHSQDKTQIEITDGNEPRWFIILEIGNQKLEKWKWNYDGISSQLIALLHTLIYALT